MSDILPIPPNPETRLDNELIARVCTRAEELLDGVMSEVLSIDLSDFSGSEHTLDSADQNESGGEYVTAHRSVSFVTIMPDGNPGSMFVDQITQEGSLITKVMLTSVKPGLSHGDNVVFDTKSYEIDQSPEDNQVLNATYAEKQEVASAKNELRPVRADLTRVAIDDPDWSQKVLDRAIADFELDSMQPKLDDQKLRELLDVMDQVDVSKRNIEVGTDDPGEIDMREVA